MNTNKQRTNYQYWVFVKTVCGKDIDLKKKECDPYCVLKMGTKQQYRTKVVMDSHQPQFDQVFRFGAITLKEKLLIQVNHFENFTSDPCLGKVQVDFSSLEQNVTHTKWYPLEGISKGEIQLQLYVHLTPKQRRSLVTHPILLQPKFQPQQFLQIKTQTLQQPKPQPKTQTQPQKQTLIKPQPKQVISQNTEIKKVENKIPLKTRTQTQTQKITETQTQTQTHKITEPKQITTIQKKPETQQNSQNKNPLTQKKSPVIQRQKPIYNSYTQLNKAKKSPISTRTPPKPIQRSQSQQPKPIPRTQINRPIKPKINSSISPILTKRSLQTTTTTTTTTTNSSIQKTNNTISPKLTKNTTTSKPITTTTSTQNSNLRSTYQKKTIFPKHLQPRIIDPNLQTKMKLEYVYGYRGWEGRNNLHYTYNGNIVYIAASIGVVLNLQTNTQNFFLCHTDTILCMGIHPSGRFVVTGQDGDEPLICVWDVETCKLIDSFNVEHDGGVVYATFSIDGKKIITIGGDDDHTITLISLEDNRIVDDIQGNDNKSLCVDFDPNDPNRFVICGIRHIYFGNCQNGKLTLKEGELNKKSNDMFLSVMINYNGDVVTSNSKGEILIWDYSEMKIKKRFRAHVGPCVSLHNTQEGVFVSGGKDGKIKLFKSDDYTLIVTISSIVGGPIRAVDYKDGFVIVGTNKNEIWRANVRTNKAECLIFCHGEQIHGLACDPKKKLIVTGSDDRTIRSWDVLKRKFLRKKPVNGQPRSVVFSNNGAFIAVGLRDGEFIIFRASDFTQIANKKEITTGVETMSFSPDSHYLIILDGSGELHVYDSFLGFKKSKIINNVGTDVSAMDWSDSNKYVRICNLGVVSTYSIETGQVETGIEGKINWVTQKCVYAKTVKDATTIDINQSNHFIIGQNSGNIKYFNTLQSEPEIYYGHSRKIIKVSFLQNSHLISIGGEDKCILQWKLLN
ncbi:wd-40 repeat protein [Anaeramoeba flamelloides]|uniref:Wd-40 repeat protein n=1 Tax=Anaeramoeba flamelloides TaxID=1746091 RepID=A0ABQ8Y5L0_9EUKA|nr:wd-40 repeat protein [Anaeramoeba flamelloides]